MKEEGICPFCRENTMLVKSHILPKWSHRILRKQLSRTDGNIAKVSVLEGTIEKSQQDDWEYLLCSTCDGLMGKYEGILKEFSTQEYRIPKNSTTGLTRWESFRVEVHSALIYDKDPNLNCFFLSNAPIDDIKRALAGLIFKAHFSNTNYDLELKTWQLNYIKRYILGKNGGKDFFIEIAAKTFNFYNVESNNPMQVQFIRILGDEIWQISLGGWIFNVCFTSKYKNHNAYLDGDWFRVQPFAFTQKFAYRSLVWNKDEEIANPDCRKISLTYELIRKCPCGQNITYEECCWKFWFNPLLPQIPSEYIKIQPYLRQNRDVPSASFIFQQPWESR